MEQLSLDSLNKTDEELIKDAIIQEINNPEYTKHLVVKTNKDQTISIRAKSFVAVKVKLVGKLKYLIIRSKNKTFFEDFISSNNVEVTKAEKQESEDLEVWSRIPVASLSDVVSLVKPISEVYITVLSELGGERFGCCSRFEICSNEKKCINPNFLMSLACAYRKNLEEGKIFYGKNKNI